ncbi:hypothetical protein GLX27_001380 [Malassezia furfur]|uniref:TIP-1 family-domain-containing protein n=1 Tax=Malassezia furfur TaxID=55194 RepID=A0ABY8EMH6_MALFU|nr:hypothetical protein CBS14141_000956 [Malassezia furfur]WFD46741.1 hypothetical protein GLX27_001380 [Malassezia furfur]
MSGGEARFEVPRYALEELRAEPQRLMHYLQAPSTQDTERNAYTAADLRLLPLLNTHAEHPDRKAAVEHANHANHEALQTLQNVETNLRTILSSVLHEDYNDEDLAEPLQHLAEQLQAPASSAAAQQREEANGLHNETLEQLYIARNCTQLLAEADEVEAHASAHADDVQAQMNALQRLAALVDGISLSSQNDGLHLPKRAREELVRRRDTLYGQLEQRYHTALREALHAIHWPPPELENPESTKNRDAKPVHLLGNARLEGAWSDVCELQLTGAELGLCGAPSCIKPLPLVSTSEVPRSTSEQPGSDAYVPLTAATILFQPILLRFRYHFDSDRSTNRLDKPEWFLRHMLALVQMNSELFAPAPDAWYSGGQVAELTRLRRPTSPDQPFRKRHIFADTSAELLHNALYPLRKKIHASMPLLAPEPALLAHSIFQYLTFDADLREMYCPALLVADGRGAVRLADDVLGNDTWFKQWLDGERVFAQRRFDAVLESPTAWTLVQADTLTNENDPSLDAVSDSARDADAAADALTTTLSACTLTNILAGITERYQPLHSLSQQCAFVIHVQRPLLSQFEVRLSRHMDAVETMSSVFSRAIPGEIGSLAASSNNDEVRGTKGITRVAKALLSAEFVCHQLEEWSETSFFLDMNENIASLDKSSTLYRLMMPSQSQDELDSASLILAMKRGFQRGAHVAANLRPLASSNSEEPETGTATTPDKQASGVWDKSRSQFQDISDRSKRALECLVVSEVLESLRPYIQRRWDREQTPEVSTAEEEKQDEDVPQNLEIPSKELLPALAKLSMLLSHLVKLCPPRLLLPLYRQIAGSLSKAVIERVLMPNVRISHQFAPGQARRFQLDVQQGWLHVVKELSELPQVTTRRARHEPTGLGNNPESAWRLLIDASQQMS